MQGLTLHLIAICFTSFCVIADAHLEDVLQRYETMHTSQVTSRRSKRSAEHDPQTKEVEFDTLGRHFHLYLQVQQNLLSADFKLFAFNKKNEKRQVMVDKDIIYQGVILDEKGNSEVSAYWEDGDKLTATIKTSEDTYYIEPSWRHLPPSDNYSLISYKNSDMKLPHDFGEKFCQSIHVDQPEHSQDNHEDGDEDDENEDRQKRAVTDDGSPVLNTCPLLLVADWKFYEKTGQKHLLRTTNYLMSLIQRVNFIYRNTDFGKGYTNMGFEIKEMWIHEEPTTDEGEHYNSEKDDWDTQRLLEVFSLSQEFQQFCLAHLFTHHGFDSGVLGLAYIGSKRRAFVGGICSPVYHRDEVDYYLNTGWSTNLNRYKRTLLTREFDLVTTHEFGHNWGSEHDPNTPECSPDSNDGGRYIMYTYSVSGREPNNKVLSNCSKRAIRAVLASKAPMCFKKNMGRYCGNAQVEEGEDCDGGVTMMKDADPCCQKNCTYRRHAVCSDINDRCCRHCRIASSKVVCHEDQPHNCKASSNCTGFSPHCPPPPNKRDNATCLTKGRCRDGQCVPLCETYGMASCICDDNATHYCNWCCMGTQEDGKMACRPFKLPGSKRLELLPQGTPCKLGYCDNGVCLKQKHNLVQRIWTIIENLSPSTLVAFMRTNIVGTVIVLSLTVWIPASCVVCYYDRQLISEEESTVEWMRSDNRSTIHPSGRFLMRQPSVKNQLGITSSGRGSIIMRQSSKKVHYRPQSLTSAYATKL